jgi:hypothetical protein
MKYDHKAYQAAWRAANRTRTAAYREAHRAEKRAYDRKYPQACGAEKRAQYSYRIRYANGVAIHIPRENPQQ